MDDNKMIDDLERAEAMLRQGGSVRFRYSDHSQEMVARAVNALIENLGARVTSEDPWGEPPWVELELRQQ